MAGKSFFTPEEAAALKRALTADGVDPLAANALAGPIDNDDPERLLQSKDNVHYDNSVWLTEPFRKSLSALRTSLIVDPADGRIPPMTSEAQQRAAARAAALKGHAFDGPESRTLSERCIMWPHEGPPMLPAPYNNVIQIFQTPENVVIFQEIIHNVRVIPLTAQPHISPSLRQLSGDSRGRWDGDTLVVDTTNFTDMTRFQGSTESLHVTERFRRVDPDTIDYGFTVEDPHTWTRPWSAEIPMMKIESRIFEYACHEGNHDLENMLSGARVLERAAEEAAKKGSK
jgi:hypothetical protein